MVKNFDLLDSEKSNKPDRGMVAGSSVPNRTVAQAGDELCNIPHLGEDSILNNKKEG